MARGAWPLLGLMAFLGIAPAGGAAEFRTYSGCCDGSAAVVLNDRLFAAASDEGQVLRLYRRGLGGAPVAALDLSAFVSARPREEADFEGAARVGDRVYWIGSHARKSDGRLESGRRVLVATRVDAGGEGDAARLVPVDRPWRGLIDALASDPALVALNLAASARLPGEAAGGLNIEGMAAGAGGALWIGFRNPVPQGRALVVPLLNPGDVVGGRPARFGAPLRPDLGGLGIRDLARVGDRYLIVAGPAEGGGKHRLFVWKGGADSPVEVVKGIPKGVAPEAIVADDTPGTRSAELLDDDGSRKIGGRRCEDVFDPAARAFRAVDVRF